MKAESKGNLYILFASILWSTGGILMKLIPWHPMAINGLRNAIALVFLLAVRRRFTIKCNKTILLAAVCLCLTTVLFTIANKTTTAANAIVLQYAAPMIVLAFTCIKERRRPTVKQVAVLLAATFGMTLFFLDQLDAGRLLGNVLALLSAFTYAGVFFVNHLPDASSDDSTLLGCLMSLLIALPFLNGAHITKEPVAWLAVVALGVVQIGLAYTLFGKGIKSASPVNASLLGLLEAMLNPTWVYLFAGERPSRWALIGSVVMIGAIVVNLLVPDRAAEKRALAE